MNSDCGHAVTGMPTRWSANRQGRIATRRRLGKAGQ